MKKLNLRQDIRREEQIRAYEEGVANEHSLFGGAVVQSVYNTPDRINFYGYRTYDDEDCYPFIYVMFGNENKIFYGEPGSTHTDIMNGVRNGGDDFAYMYMKNTDGDRSIRGRYYLVDFDVLEKECAVFAFWKLQDIGLMKKIVQEVCEEQDLFDKEIFIANGMEPLIQYNKPGNDNVKIQDNSEQFIQHMLPPEQKHKVTEPFRQIRDKKIGQKLTMDNGKEMPMAQYNALRYVDENVINESVDKNLEEKVRKAVRDMIKDGELPKYYGKEKEPLEMAEHYGHILKKVFGEDYEIYHTQNMEDDDICCAVIDDEFKKNGGHYDMDDCENHLESIKKWLDKIIKEEYSMMFTKKIYLTESQLSYIKKELENARKETNTSPTEAQKSAGNYKMGRVNIFGFDIAIENPKGSYRRGKDKSGKSWEVLMKNDYGYFTHTKAIDGDAVDVFLGKDLDCKTIFAIDQKIDGKFDETKVMFGFKTEDEAKKAYLSNYNKGWKGFWRITEVSIDDFKDWLYDGYKQRKPFSEYNEIKKKKLNEMIDFYKNEKLLLGDDGDYVHVIEDALNEVISEYDNKNATPFLTRESIDEFVDNNELGDVLQSFDVQKQLNQKFWVNGRLNSRVRLRLLDIADTFFDSMEVNWVKPKDIIMTGSLANYNWSKFSDIDLHIIVNFREVDDRVEFVKDYFDSKKTIWNNQHENLKIYGFPVELYVQDESEEHTASGVYSLEKDRWIKEPERDNLAAVKLDKERIAHKTKNIVDKIDKLEGECDGEKDTEKLDILSSKVKDLFDKIKGMRKDSLKGGSELGEGNIIFKTLRRLGYIGKLVDLKRITFDKFNSIK